MARHFPELQWRDWLSGFEGSGLSVPGSCDSIGASVKTFYKWRRKFRDEATRDCDAHTRKSQRSEHAAPLLKQLGAWLERETFLAKSLIGKAATYTRNQWTALNRYVEDGDLSIDNNFAELAMRPIAIGRNNWLFVGSERASRSESSRAHIISRQLQEQVRRAPGLPEGHLRPPRSSA